jgi:hypothetical protein
MLRLLQAAAAAFLLSAAALAHDPGGAPNWIATGDYRGPDGVHCCGPQDCAPLADGDVEVRAGGYFIKSLGEPVPFSEAKPSEDGHYWRCRKYDGTRRCFFSPMPAS